MQRTEKYYEADAFRREATGRILAVEPGKTGGKLALDGTVFLPGGRRPAGRPRHPDPGRRHRAPRYGCP